ncbi:carbohydrate-binding protein, partial [Paenibacillus sp. 598K]|uniref:carbohydrate-binding protein n=1 Tax=Paenibacillus sp. 598K TaxID=1117987 RepID=UPI00162AE20C
AQASVGSALTERKLTVRPATAGQPEDLVLAQGNLSLTAGKLYLLSFDAAVSGDVAPIEVNVGTAAQPALYADHSFTIGTQMSSHSMMFTAGTDAAATAGLLQFKLGSLASALTLDNVALKEMKPPVAVDGIKRLEAEDFSAMQGVQKGEDGLSVGWIDPGDWMQYIVDVKQADTYTISYFVSSGYEGGGSLMLLSKQGSVFTGDLPAGEISRADADRAYEMDVANTGGWGSFMLVNQEVELDAGIQTLQLYAPHVNVDYMILTAHNHSGATGNLIRNGTFDTDTVTFDAYSTVDRPIEMGLGSIDASNNYQYTDFLNGSKPRFWLTGEKQQYQFSFEMTHPSETNSKLEFDLGQYVVGDTVYDTPGTLYLDNIQLHSTVVD